MYDIYGGRLKRGHCEVHPDIPETYPCYICITELQELKELKVPGPIPTDEDLCDMCAPHSYYGDDQDGGRCYCGNVRYPAGGGLPEPKNRRRKP